MLAPEDPLHGPPRHAEVPRDLREALAGFVEGEDSVPTEDSRRAPEALALSPRASESGANPLPDQLPLEFRHGGDHGEHHPARRATEIELLSQGSEADPEMLELLQGPHQVRH